MPANYVLLERIELNASATSITFNNIPQSGYTDLKVVASARGTSSDVFINCKLAFNGSESSFSQRAIYGNGSSAASFSRSDNLNIFLATAANNTANTFANAEIYIPNYTGSTNKSFSVDDVTEYNATESYAQLHAGLWSSTAAITSMTMTPQSGSFAQYSTFSLYGLAAVGTTPVIAPKASGGNRIDNDGTYWYHTFTSTGAFVPQVGLSCDVLMVAGGGGAGNGTRGAGAGAGGLVYSASQALTATSYSITIGAGGTTGTFQDNGGAGNFGTGGSNTTFTGLTTATGGGRGGANDGSSDGTGGNGGSGGGGWSVNSGGTGSQGNNGAAGLSTPNYRGGGGGGAGAAGTSGSSGGAGGNGSSTYSSWGLATSTGQNVSGTVYYAGGGSGADYNSATSGTAGLGGGGKGNNTSPIGQSGTAGTVNTGGGGGSGGNGGSGIVIIRYPIA
jgi:hypothetical protein